MHEFENMLDTSSTNSSVALMGTHHPSRMITPDRHVVSAYNTHVAPLLRLVTSPKCYLAPIQAGLNVPKWNMSSSLIWTTKPCASRNFPTVLYRSMQCISTLLKIWRMVMRRRKPDWSRKLAVRFLESILERLLLQRSTLSRSELCCLLQYNMISSYPR